MKIIKECKIEENLKFKELKIEERNQYNPIEITKVSCAKAPALAC